jgi:hypothetical protein
MQHSYNHLFNSENQTKVLSYTTFPVKKTKVGKILNYAENYCLIILSIHILKLEISRCDTNAFVAPSKSGASFPT